MLVRAAEGEGRGAYGNDKVVLLGLLAHRKGETVQKPVAVSFYLRNAFIMCLLVLQDDDRVGVADRGLEQTLCVLGAVRADNLQTGNASVPGSVILRMLGGDTGGETVGAAEGDVAGLDTAGHVMCLRGRVDDLVDGLHGEVERHELALSHVSDVAGEGPGNVQWGGGQRAQRRRSDPRSQTR
jgi:hypothetical protein